MEKPRNEQLAEVNRQIEESQGPPSGAAFFLPRHKATVMDAMNIRIKGVLEPESVAEANERGEKRKTQSPERKSGRRLVATAAAIVGLMVSGCGGGETSAEKSVEAPVDTANPVAYSLNRYRDEIYFHRRAEVAVNSCVAWDNVSGGITVVENPGVAVMPLTSSKDKHHAFFVFGYPDTDGEPPLIQQMNGPETFVDDKNRVFGGGSSGTILQIDLEKSKSYYAYATERVLTQHPTHADNGQVYFRDKQTGEPVMNTVFTNGPLSMGRVNDVCVRLQRGGVVNSL